MQKIEPNDVVRVRSRRYLVEESTSDLKHQTQFVSLRCLEDDAQGEPLKVIWEHEVDAQVISDEAWSRVASQGFDQGYLFQAYYNTLRWNFVTSTDPTLFQAPYRAGIQLQDYQLEPLRKALEMAHVNLFIADDVGLGKTIEAGLILRELIIRQKVKRCVICAPPSVVHQWRDEMEQRFGISFKVYDREYIQEHRRQRGFGANPWHSDHFFIVSHAMIRRHEHFTLLKDWLGKSSPQSLLILDEAHHAAPAGGSLYGIDSKLTQTMRALCARFQHRLFLSATPHNGHSNSFSTLLELLDPNTFHRGMKITPELLNKVMVRRLKKDLNMLSASFPERNIEAYTISDLPTETPELKWAKQLQEYWKLRQARLAQEGANKRRSMAAKLPVILLQKRLLSSLVAFKNTLNAHYYGLKRVYDSSKELLELKEEELKRLQDHEHSYQADDDEDIDEVKDEVHEADVKAQLLRVEQATVSHPELLKPELTFLKALLKEVESVDLILRNDPKLNLIVEWLQKHVCDQIKSSVKGGPRVKNATWKPRRLLIFTEYAHTKDYLLSALNYMIYGKMEGDTSLVDQSLARVASYCGGMNEDQRRLIKEAFNRPFDDPDSDLRILIATDAAREGINLQSKCYDLFHYDIPWNPGRLEQRNGRIDRKLQPQPQVNCYYFNFTQRVEDRVLDTLIKKSQTIGEELGNFNPVIGDAVKLITKEGIDAERADAMIAQLESLTSTQALEVEAKSLAEQAQMDEEALEEHLKEVQLRGYTVKIRSIKSQLNHEQEQRLQEKLRDQVAVLSKRLQKAKEWIDFDQAMLRHAMNAALAWSNLPALRPVSNAQGLYELPDWSAVLGRDPSWVHTLDALRSSQKAGQTTKVWRQEAPLLPVVFEDDGTMRHGSVQLHLEHRVVRRLLQRFVAHGFTQDGLNRATVLLSDDHIPSVILLGRLSLYGEGASRLHDKLIMVEAHFPNGELEVLDDTTDSHQRLKQALVLSHQSAQSVSEARVKQLRERVATDLQALKPLVEQRAELAKQRAEAQLTTRGLEEGRKQEAQLQVLKRELKSLKTSLLRSHTTIEENLQEGFAFMETGSSLYQEQYQATERQARQLEVDLNAVQERLKELTPSKIKEEAKSVQATFEVKLTRLEPVGIVYLWPKTRA